MKCKFLLGIILKYERANFSFASQLEGLPWYIVDRLWSTVKKESFGITMSSSIMDITLWSCKLGCTGA